MVALSPGLPAVLAGRLLYGVGIGFAMHAAPAYIAGGREEGGPAMRAHQRAALAHPKAPFPLTPNPTPLHPISVFTPLLSPAIHACLLCHHRDQPGAGTWPAHQPEGGLHCGRHIGGVRRGAVYLRGEGRGGILAG